ncbi:MAG: enoyl-CoA hydratase/isomerase family protein [Pseudomonadales bacterium]
MNLEHIIYEQNEAVVTITLNRPETLNALTPAMREGLYEAIMQADGDNSVRAIVITGAGRGFCSGGDVKAMNAANQNKQKNPVEEKIAPIRDRAVLAMRDATKPVIAAVNGAAAGAGMNIALACDIRIASTGAKFGQTFSRRGLHPDWGGTYFLPRLVGMAKACELIWSGKMIEAEEALELGIVSYLSKPEELMKTAIEMANGFAEGPPIAIRLAKRALYKSMDSSLREALEYETYAQTICSGSQDAKEGIAAFVEKRAPQFTGD